GCPAAPSGGTFGEREMITESKQVSLAVDGLQQRLADKVAEVARQPEHSWADGFCSFMAEPDGRHVLRVGATHCPPDMDIWQGLRSPAQVGMYPIGLEDIWMHYAAANVRSTRADGSPNPLAMPEPFADAMERFKRAVIISGMLAMNPTVYETYAGKIERGDADPPDDYCRARGEVSKLINKAVGRLALSLMAPNRAVVPMTGDNAGKVIDGTRSAYTKGKYHGPCNNAYPQNSIAVMTGLLRFGVSRLPFRDELGPDGQVRRLMGQYASVVIFDDHSPAGDNGDGVTLLEPDRLGRMRRVNDYADAAEDVVADRYCTYNLRGADGDGACRKCIKVCPSGALAHSSPDVDGAYSQKQLSQKHRFSGGTLDFDAGNCGRERGQKAQLYAEYVCARCEAICAARGIRKSPEEIARINAPA
ncbi:hypothetical protein LCGC14_2517330, partial [marine sediment metagenome]